MPGINNINGVHSIAKAVNRAYTYGRADSANIASTGAKWYESSLIKFKECQGETFNNLVTAAGTAFVAPIFIIHNPLAKEDKETKQYTAARQPISAIITLAAQVPIMGLYDSAIDYAATKYHFDKCDLSAAPPKSYVKHGLKQKYRDYLYECAIKGEKPINKKKKMQEFYLDMKDNAFYNELKRLREGARNGNVPDYLAGSMTQDGYVKLENMISPNDVNEAKKQLIEKYFSEKHGINIAKDLGLDEKTKIDSLESLDKTKIKNALKDKGIKVTKEMKKELKAIFKAEADGLARQNVVEFLNTSAKVKTYAAGLYREAKEELAEYQRQLLIKKTPNDEIQKLMQAKNDELFKKLHEHALKLKNNAPISVPQGSMELNAKEAETLFKKIDLKLTKGTAADKLIRHLKTSEGTTFEELLKSVQIKKWLTARINISQKTLSEFKQKSGLVVGLAILPFTCGLLNWAYPRIMEEWFPHLTHAKKASAQAKEAK